MSAEEVAQLRAELEAKTAANAQLEARILALQPISEGVPLADDAQLVRMASVAKYDGLMQGAGLTGQDRATVQRVRELREGGTAVVDFSAEDFAAWQQLDSQWREMQESDEAIAITLAEIEEVEAALPSRTERKVAAGTAIDTGFGGIEGGALSRQISVAKYDTLLLNPQLTSERREAVVAMREKRLARELVSFTDDERDEWERLNTLAQQMEAADSEIARVLAEPTPAELAAAEQVDTGSLPGVTAEMLTEHEQVADQVAAEIANLAVATVLQNESPADAAANTDEIEELPWTPIPGLDPQAIQEHAECATAREDADAIFAMDSVVAAAENAEADFEMAAKTAAHTIQDPGQKPRYTPAEGEPEPAGSAGEMTVVATAVHAEVVGDILPMDELISVTARAAGIDEAGLREYIHEAKSASLIRTMSRERGIPEDELRLLVARHSGAPPAGAPPAAIGEPEPEPEA